MKRVEAVGEMSDRMVREVREQLANGGEEVMTPSAPPARGYIPVTDERYQGLAAEKGYDQSNPRTRIQKTAYSHEAMIDMIVAEPGISQNQLASNFGYTVPWVSRVIGSDAFQGALAKRREEVTDPFLIATVEERLRGLATQSLDVIAEKLQSTQSADIALKALDITIKALGFGARDRGGGGNTQNNYIVQIPGKARSAEEWAEAHSPIKAAKLPEILEHLPMGSTIDRDPTVQPKMTEILEG